MKSVFRAGCWLSLAALAGLNSSLSRKFERGFFARELALKLAWKISGKS
jgi:hypothetical protein